LHPLVWLSWLLFAATSYFLYQTKSGLALRAVGESPTSAHAIGYPVIRIRYFTTLFGGAMAGIAGAYVSLVYTALWTEGLIAGRGWIAVALVVFATWRPGRCLAGAYLFGGATMAQLFAQSAGIGLPSELMSALPYIATIVVLALISRNETLMRLSVPASLGKPFNA
jgi:simple sugar transport system permease protein